MRALFAREGATQCAFVNEAWTVDVTTRAEHDRTMRWLAEHGSLADYPGRIEVVMFCAEDAEGGAVQARRRIVRPAGGKPRLGPLHVMDVRGVETSGPFVGMLPRRATVH